MIVSARIILLTVKCYQYKYCTNRPSLDASEMSYHYTKLFYLSKRKFFRKSFFCLQLKCRPSKSAAQGYRPLAPTPCVRHWQLYIQNSLL